ncbi:MAG: hypothetical protein HYY18_11880, partial [Planctomycetes bacterium]|nr:hypothetical protein [Planctomycetota bacterium]
MAKKKPTPSAEVPPTDPAAPAPEPPPEAPKRRKPKSTAPGVDSSDSVTPSDEFASVAPQPE